ncbi:hypothetical protein FPQ18DRAFT_332752 [Pyronema domesticum]|uniref:Splicing factor U2AF subunit n=1 Tax=Pyronema omphalodes (strain CBS 100304) TaxID=1076935 RepID=U4LS47_PYROM|nr:hypothetical protein FPQ18DRAFT_332752 [Pyronema domesticum]CCX34389.1 Similar to Splicing factor U2AF 65 kDa subunit; acc. no. P26369 [Pyronema omphalodes CBS 100304]
MNGDSYSSRGGDRYGGGGHHSSSTRDYHSSDRRRDRGDRGDRNDRGADRGADRGVDRADRGADRADRGEHHERRGGDREHGDRRRERSRSPGGHRRSRRDDYYEGGADRDRYRDREERYGGAGRDREYERERGGDRDRRRGGDRRGGGGGERSSRHEEARQARQDPFAANRAARRSATPPPKRKEPTPDLTDVAPITERKRRMTMWDIKPQGYENVTSEQAKLSGMFPLPGAPRQAPMDPTRLHAFMTQPNSVATASALKPTNSRQAKRLLINGVPQGTDEDTLTQFFNRLLAPLNVISGPEPVTSTQLNGDKSLGLVEFKNTSDATVCLAFSGIEFGGSNLDIRRPKDYIVPLVVEDPAAETEPGQISSTVPDSPNKILVSRIPDYLHDEQVIELLKSFGELKAFVLVKDTTDDISKGIAFCEYLDPAATDIAVEGLNNMELGDSTLKVQRASIGMKQAAGVEMGVNAMAMMAGTTSADLEPSRVLQLLNMVTPEELMDNDEYEEICEDIHEECQKFGKLIDLKVPRPSGGSRQTAGVGKIFVRFESLESSQEALKGLAGRKFADRTVVCTYFSEENYEVSAF